MFFLNLGLRVSELCSLNLTSIQDNVLHVIGKGDKERTVFLNNACIQSLAVYLENERPLIQGASTNEALFLSQKGTRLTRQTVAKIVKQINIDSGLNKAKITPHKLRHTSATLMYKNGADMRSFSISSVIRVFRLHKYIHMWKTSKFKMLLIITHLM